MHTLMTRCGALLAFMLLFTVAAVAQTTAPVTTIGLGELLNPWLQLLFAFAAVVIPALGTWVAWQIQRRTGATVDNTHMQAFQQALLNGAGLLVVKASQMANNVTIDARHPAIADAIRYVNQSAPDAIKYFGVTPESIAEKLIAKLGLINPPPANNTVNVVAAPAVGGPPA